VFDISNSVNRPRSPNINSALFGIVFSHKEETKLFRRLSLWT
jgi:hypothetical protein